MCSAPVGKSSPAPLGGFLASVFLLILLAGSPQAARSADYTVIEGIVERVSGSFITVRDRIYDFGGARVLSPSGKALYATDLKPGEKVNLLMKNGKVTAVVLYPSMLE